MAKKSDEELTDDLEADKGTSSRKKNKTKRKYADKLKQAKVGSSDELSEGFEKLSVKSQRIILINPTYECFIKCFKEKSFKNVITIVGAGISTSAGIPDFRTPDTGLYANLDKYRLPNPKAIFDINYFLENPAPFFDLAKKLLPGDFTPTYAHFFLKLLDVKGILLRHYTQNIDGLERKVGISDEKLIEAHGTFNTSHCVNCNHMYTFEWTKEQMYTSQTGIPTCIMCNKLVKPDLVFFGESLPNKFFQAIPNDFKEADLLIIMGSSLLIEPFASLVKRAHKDCPRITINDQEVGMNVGISYAPRKNRRDVFIKGSCDDGCTKIVESLGWQDDIQALMDQYFHEKEGERLSGQGENCPTVS